LELGNSDEDTIAAMRSQIAARDGFHPVVIGDKSSATRVSVDAAAKETRIDGDTIGIVTVHDGPGLPAGELIAPAVGADRRVPTTYHHNLQEGDRLLAACR